MKTKPFLVIIGPSAVGRATIADALRSNGHVRIIPSWTTRPPSSEDTHAMV